MIRFSSCCKKKFGFEAGSICQFIYSGLKFIIFVLTKWPIYRLARGYHGTPTQRCPGFTHGKSFPFALAASRQKPCNSNESKCTTPWHFNLATREKAQIGHYTTFEKARVKKRTHITDIHYTCCDNFKTQMISAGKQSETLCHTLLPQATEKEDKWSDLMVKRECKINFAILHAWEEITWQ